MRRVFSLLIGLLLLALLLPVWVLSSAHLQIRAVDPALPDEAALLASVAVGDGPTRVRYVNSSSQQTGAGRTMGHPAFVLDWADGRRFMIDAGMEPEAALRFGRPMEFMLDAEPAVAHGAVVEQMGEAARAIRGLAFTHLHTDHTQGVIALCRFLRRFPGSPLMIYQTPWQFDERNYTTEMGFAHIVSAGELPEARGCAATSRLAEQGTIYRIPGFPGLVAVAAGGHTPGSTLYLARVAGQHWLFSGDVTNTRKELLENLPKSRLYSLLIVPEAAERLERMRLWLAKLDRKPELTVVVSHDLTALEKTGIPPW